MSSPSKQRTWVRKLNDDESKLGRALAGGHVPSIDKAIVRIDSLKQAVFLELMDQVDNECSQLCQISRKTSLFCKVPVNQLEEFKWDGFIEELRNKAPLLLQLKLGSQYVALLRDAMRRGYRPRSGCVLCVYNVPRGRFTNERAAAPSLIATPPFCTCANPFTQLPPDGE